MNASSDPKDKPQETHFTEIDLGALDADTFSGSEALWMVKALAHSHALALAYKEIMPDTKARKAWEVIALMQEDRVKAAYPGAEAYLVIHKAKSAARKGVDAQKQKMREELANVRANKPK